MPPQQQPQRRTVPSLHFTHAVCTIIHTYSESIHCEIGDDDDGDSKAIISTMLNLLKILHSAASAILFTLKTSLSTCRFV